MDADWRKVWDRRRLPDVHEVRLQELIDLDGFDSGPGRVAAVDWRAYARTVAELVAMAPGDSVYEVGTGGGAFLYALRELADIRIAGSDYSPAMVDTLRRVLPEGDFAVVEADRVPTTPTADIVLSNGVFLYFPDLSYAERVLRRMIAKARRAVAVLEIPDLAKREAVERLRRERTPPEVYEQKYAALRHLYFDRAWFEDIAARTGLTCSITTSPIPNYAQGEFRFAAILTRHAHPPPAA